MFLVILIPEYYMLLMDLNMKSIDSISVAAAPSS
ncbi:MAG: hypothetical protein RL331_377 [Bacteroidota bacterium]|jgi:hypothetical protein